MNKNKKFLNSRILPNWVLIIFMIAVVILATFGWKITYDPQLENSWSAISAVGGWVSAVISGVAIWFAVSIPKRIAQEQNKIALFEKRFSSYIVFLKYTSFADMLQQINTIKQLRQAFTLNFIEYNDTTDSKELILMIKNDEKWLMSGLFLFPDFCDGKTIHDILQSMLEIAVLMQCKDIDFSEEDKKKLTLFYNNCMSFKKNYMEGMRRQLTI